MTGTYVLIIIAVYFAVLYVISLIVSKKHSDNDAFFLGNKKSPWWLVAIAMLGTSISGVTFVSVPGMVGSQDMTYMQMVFGFFFGYLVIAYVLLPLYYKLNLTTIYGYLDKRLGFWSYKTGASFFILSKLVGAAARLYLVALILQTLVFDEWNIPFYATVIGIILLIWAYTHKSGIKTILWTDSLQTVCFIAALILIIWQVVNKMDMNFGQIVDTIKLSEHSRIFVFDDWGSRQNFFKQFFSGMFITIVMSGLDQDMMQKNLSCKNLKDARKNMNTYGFMFIPINFLFLCLGILLLVFMNYHAIAIPEKSDNILPLLATEYLGFPILILFTIGIIAAAFSSADSALTSLTTSVCVDLLNVEKKENKLAKKTRMRVHIVVSIVFAVAILMINVFNKTNVLDAIYTLASYTYGPLLGMFCFGLFTKRSVKDNLTPAICILSPVLCYLLEIFLFKTFDYKVGYEILMLNGLLTFLGLWVFSHKTQNTSLIP